MLKSTALFIIRGWPEPWNVRFRSTILPIYIECISLGNYSTGIYNVNSSIKWLVVGLMIDEKYETQTKCIHLQYWNSSFETYRASPFKSTPSVFFCTPWRKSKNWVSSHEVTRRRLKMLFFAHPLLAFWKYLLIEADQTHVCWILNGGILKV